MTTEVAVSKNRHSRLRKTAIIRGKINVRRSWFDPESLKVYGQREV
jgi:hypothetical protein